MASERKNPIHEMLKNRSVYLLSQAILAPGAHAFLQRHLEERLALTGGKEYRILELGCGAGAFALDRRDIQYIGTDINGDYLPTSAPRREFLVMDAVSLDFPNESFDRVYSCGLHHHLSDDQALASLREAARVLRHDGEILLLDNIWPTSVLNVSAWILRRLDRGMHIRSPHQILELLAAAALEVISSEIYFYSWNGLEAMTLRARKIA